MKRVEDIAELKRIANRMRQNIVKMMVEPGGALSATEMVVALFFQVMRHDPTRPAWPDRDRFILSKGHAAAALYCAYAQAGYIDEATLMSLGKLNSPLQGPLDQRLLPLLEASTGLLGNGLSIGLGSALTGRMEERDYRVYVMMGDSECREDQVWEAAAVAAYHKTDNLCSIVDSHEKPEALAARWEASGWNALVVDGHDFPQVLEALRKAPETRGRPTSMVARTVRGKGVSFLERSVELGDAAPSAEQVRLALEELEKEAAALA